MKQNEIKKCLVCGRGVMACGSGLFYRVRIEQLVINVSAIKRQHGLEQFLGSAALASVMGPDENIADPTSEPVDGLICLECSAKSLAEILEIAGEKTEEEVCR